MIQKFGDEIGDINPGIEQLLGQLKRLGPVRLGDRRDEIKQELAVYQPQGRHHILLADRIAGKGRDLIHERQRVTHRTIRLARQKQQSRIIDPQLFPLRDRAQVPRQFIGRDATEVITLGARKNRFGNFERLGRGENEHHVRRRLLERLEQGIERRAGQAVHFVDDIDAPFSVGRQVADILPEGTDIIHPGIGGGVDFQHVERAPAGDLLAGGTFATRRFRGAVDAVDRFGQNPRDRRFAGPARTAKQIPRSDPIVL